MRSTLAQENVLPLPRTVTEKVMRSEFAIKSYAAGLFEGEGCISIYRMRSRQAFAWQLNCVIRMGDREPLDLLQATWAGRVYSHEPQNAKRRGMHQWRISSRRAAVFLSDIRPFLASVRLQTKADLALAFQAQKLPGGPRGSAYHERQQAFTDAMKLLNRRGDRSLGDNERYAVLKTLEEAA